MPFVHAHYSACLPTLHPTRLTILCAAVLGFASTAAAEDPPDESSASQIIRVLADEVCGEQSRSVPEATADLLTDLVDRSHGLEVTVDEQGHVIDDMDGRVAALAAHPLFDGIDPDALLRLLADAGETALALEAHRVAATAVRVHVNLGGRNVTMTVYPFSHVGSEHVPDNAVFASLHDFDPVAPKGSGQCVGVFDSHGTWQTVDHYTPLTICDGPTVRSAGQFGIDAAELTRSQLAWGAEHDAWPL
jgi:hypothetical protein